MGQYVIHGDTLIMPAGNVGLYHYPTGGSPFRSFGVTGQWGAALSKAK